MSEGWSRDPESARRIEERTRRSTAARHSTQAPAKLLDFYEYREDELLTCSRCGWTGQAGQAPSELHRELFDVSCPACDKMLLVVSWPTAEETRKAAAAGNADAQRGLAEAERTEARAARAKALELKADSELPELDGEHLEFTWDFEEADDESWTVIRCGGRIVWRELAYYEGWERFNEVKDILKHRLGERFESLDPTEASGLYLYGDDLTAPSKIERR